MRCRQSVLVVSRFRLGNLYTRNTKKGAASVRRLRFSFENGELKVSGRLAKHTWQAMHGDSHSCKIYRPLPKQEPINRLSGKHPRTPLTQISSVATHRSDANGAWLLFTAMLFFFAFLSFLKIAQLLIICLVYGKVSKLITNFLEFGIRLFFRRQLLGKFHLQTLDGRKFL